MIPFIMRMYYICCWTNILNLIVKKGGMIIETIKEKSWDSITFWSTTPPWVEKIKLHKLLDVSYRRKLILHYKT